MRRKTAFIVLYIVIVSTFCTCFDNVEYETKTKKKDDSLVNDQNTFVYNMIPRDSTASISKEYSLAINSFCINLLDVVYDSDEYREKNLVLSPFSLSRNLSVLVEAVVGTSRDELLTLLGGKAALDDARSALAEVLYADDSIILQCADAFWYDSSYFIINESYKDSISSKYGVAVKGLAFSKAEFVVNTVNTWIKTNTSGHIDVLLQQNDITSATAAFITSTIYFEANWTSPFDVESTTQDTFYTPSGEIITDMMVAPDYEFEIYDYEEYKGVKLYYGQNSQNFFYLDIYMPLNKPLNEFIQEDALELIANNTANYTLGRVTIPKFMFETEVDMIPYLKVLGVKKIFDTPNKDFSMMFSSESGDTDLYVSMIRQKSGIKADEEGTVAYSAVVSDGTSKAYHSESSPELCFDRPFVYFIRAGKNGLVLFAGVVNNPQESR